MTQVNWTTAGKSREQLLQEANEETSKPLPWQCWDIPGFQACHEEAGHRTYRTLVEDNGLTPGTPLYEEFYPLFLRNYVFDCQRHFACTYGALEELRKAAERQEGMAFLTGEKSAWLKWVAVVGLFGVGFWWYKGQRK